MHSKIFLLFTYISFALHSYCQNKEIFDPDSVRKVIEAEPIISNLRIDGLLNESQWQRARPSPAFINQ